MSSSDDHTFPATPFPGNNSDYLSSAPDLILQSSLVTEKVVDTQSGFQITIKPLNGHTQSLLVRRRTGTPPSNSVLLTPDESLKLARILASSSIKRAGVRESTTPTTTGYSAKPNISRQKHLYTRVVAIVAITVVASGLIVLATTKTNRSHINVISNHAADKVEQFTRNYLFSLLDFSATTYRQSQIQAMASMAPELLDEYWRDTSFPLDSKKLRELPQGLTVTIDSIKQEPAPDHSIKVEAQGKILDSKQQIASQIHLLLHLQTTPAGDIKVVQQQDLSVTH